MSKERFANKRIVGLLIAAPVLSGWPASAAKADSPAISYGPTQTALSFQGPSTDHSYLMGFYFQPTQNLDLTSLGWWDPYGNGASFGSHRIGIYDVTTDRLLTQVVFNLSQTTFVADNLPYPTTGGADLHNAGFRYFKLGSPLVLSPTDTYSIAGTMDANGNGYYAYSSAAPQVAGIKPFQFDSTWFDGWPYPDYNTPLPDTFSSLSTGGTGAQYLVGPNFLDNAATSSVPEPSSWLIGGAMLTAGSLIIVRRRKSVEKEVAGRVEGVTPA